MRTVAIIQARMNSTRFPGKVLADLCGKPVLKHVIDRVRMCSRVDEVAVALSCEDDWEPIAGRCEEWDVTWHAFDARENDVLSRYVKAVDFWNAELCLRVCGDNPLIMPSEIDALIREFSVNDGGGRAYFSSLDVPIIRKPTGYFAEVVTTQCLIALDHDLASDDARREHVTAAMYERDWMSQLPVPSWYTTLNPPNAAIDTPEDLERVAEMLNTKGE